MFRDSYDVTRNERAGTDATAILRAIVAETGIRNMHVLDSSATSWRAVMLAAYQQNRLDALAANVKPFSFGASALVKASASSMACADTFYLRSMTSAIDDMDADLMGGSVALSKTGQLSTYKTYNPLLFEVTRRMWNSQYTPLRDAKLAGEIDGVGRWGHLTEYLQKLAFTSTSVEQVQQAIFTAFAPFMKMAELIQMYSANAAMSDTVAKLMRTMLRGERKQRQRIDVKGAQYFDLGVGDPIVTGIDPFGRPQRVYEPAMLFWPLGATFEDTVMGVQLFAQNPLDYLRFLKHDEVDPALTRSLTYDYSLTDRAPLTPDMQAAFSKADASDTLLSPLAEDDSPERVQLRRALGAILRDQGRDDLAVFALESDARYADRLRRMGMKPSRVEALLQERRNQENRALRAFQANPGVVRQRVMREIRGETPDDKFLTVSVETVPLGRTRSAAEEITGVYDKETIDTLRRGMTSYPRQPRALMPAIDEKEWRRAGVLRQQDFTWEGRDAIDRESVLKKVEGESKAFTDIISSVDDAIRELDDQIEKM
jgi:hypothetical protein